MDDKPKYRLANVAILGIMSLAGLADLITFIPIAGDIIGPIFWVGASVYFWKSGLGMINPRRLATSLLSFVAELIPIVQEFPTIIVGTAAIIIMSRIEDRTGLSLNPLQKKPGITPPRGRKLGMNNKVGVRTPNINTDGGNI
jgi:hypothetical protein